MSAIVIGPELKDKLASVRKVTELRDADGRLVGHFLPPEPIFPSRPELTVEELKRRRKAGGGKPLSEIIRRLTGQ